ncbi:endonuclease [Mycoplasma crocodyli]|uniref:Putative extracellular nuclease, EndA/NucM family n=1 Tax=Mycoplasma crocodyli (strain ATCC 51981 / MP145) TaxID=512564 RepID=D5E5W0_MYCCM|nr:endonuclease [Mycoplasma crocodyli]ADE19870.1 putative extracellular nuclease, EndA/NucM family [Mycoplasma crocodyli MP145]
MIKRKLMYSMLSVVTIALTPTVVYSCNKQNNEEPKKLDEYSKSISFLPISKVDKKEDINLDYLKTFSIIGNNDLMMNIEIKEFLLNQNDLIIKYNIINSANSNVSGLYEFKINLNQILNKNKSDDENKPVTPVTPVTPGIESLTYDSSNNYYQELQGLRGKELFEAIHKLQKKYVGGIKQYGDLYGIYKDAFQDKYYEKDNSLLDIYSENPSGNDPYNYNFNNNGSSAANEGQGFNREHVIPQSWFSKANPTRNDAHFVWPTDIKVNALRGNLPHNNVVTIVKTSLNGTKIGNDVSEPIDEFKGDIARAYFYFQATHQNGYSSNGNLVFDANFPYFKKTYLDVYINWANKDKLSEFDVDRNNQIAKHFNGLRNPFSDYPELVSLIWGNGTETFINKGVLIKINK